MKISVLGTGMVGKAHAARLAELGHDVAIGTKDVAATQASDKADYIGQTFREWHEQNPSVQLMSLHDATVHGDVVMNVLLGQASVEALKNLQSELHNKVLIDISNPLAFGDDGQPFLTVSNTNSLGEQIQKALPDVKVVKTLNTVTAPIQVNPGELSGANHHVYIGGDDLGAKNLVIEILKSYGWKHILDLGDMTSARATEAALLLTLRILNDTHNFHFNFQVVTE
jgi:predicted dinucleotide-binding enzyme